MPSRIRRATLRMTLESSTTRQIFITPSLLYQRATRNVPFSSSALASCGDRTWLDIQNAIDVEHDHQLAFEPVNAGGDASEPPIEIGGLCLAGSVWQLHHFANGID